MSPIRKPLMLAGAFAAAGLGLSACSADKYLTPQGHLSADYGVAVRQAEAAQIDDPDPRYDGAPGSTGPRMALAQDRYNKGKVIEPAAANASQVGSQGGSSAPAPSLSAAP